MGLRSEPRRLLQRALEFDPDNRDALLALATDLERDGDYDAAIPYLEQLVAIPPPSVEGRLRLAINLRRVGRERDAVARLDQLTTDPVADPDIRPDIQWAAEVACEELARMRIEHDDARGAAALLRRAIERFPDSESLRLELAFALDRGGDPAPPAASSTSWPAAPPGRARPLASATTTWGIPP